MANPVGVYQPGKANTKTKLSLTTRVANSSQKKMDTLARIDSTTLRTMYKFYDLEMIIQEAEYKKTQQNMQSKIETYQKQLRDFKLIREKTSGKTRTFLTDQPETELPVIKLKYGEFSNSDPERVRSVRRSTKPIISQNVKKSLNDLEKMRDRNLYMYHESIIELEKMKSHVPDVEFKGTIPRRSYAPFTVRLPRCPIISSLRSKIQYSESQLNKLKSKLEQLSEKFAKPQKEESEKGSDDEEEDNSKSKESLNIYCDTNDDKGRRIPLLPQLKGKRRTSQIKFDLDKLKTVQSCSNDLLNLLALSSKNNFIEVIHNPFDDGKIPEVTRSRLLLETKKDNNMHTWLGFKSKQDLEKALKDNPQAIKQIPAAILTMIEEEVEDDKENLDEMEFSDSDSSAADDDDLRFKVFDEKKVMKARRRRSKAVQISEDVQTRLITAATDTGGAL